MGWGEETNDPRLIYRRPGTVICKHCRVYRTSGVILGFQGTSFRELKIQEVQQEPYGGREGKGWATADEEKRRSIEIGGLAVLRILLPGRLGILYLSMYRDMIYPLGRDSSSITGG